MLMLARLCEQEKPTMLETPWNSDRDMWAVGPVWMSPAQYKRHLINGPWFTPIWEVPGG